MRKIELIITGVVVSCIVVYTIKKLQNKNSITRKVIKKINNVTDEQEELMNNDVELHEVKERVKQSGEEQSEAIKNRHQEANVVMKSSLEEIFNNTIELPKSSTFKEIEDDLEDLLK